MNPARLLFGLALFLTWPGRDVWAGVVHQVKTPAEFHQAARQARPGEVISLREGEWRDAELLVEASGTREHPVVVRASAPGRVILTGNASLRVSGEHVVIEGLWFKNATPQSGDVVSFRKDARHAARHCRLRECAITEEPGAGDGRERKWLSLYGTGHIIERCHFAGKTGKGTLLVVWLDREEAGHLIEGNYFGSRQKLGKNGGEIIRVGDSDTSMQSARCLVRGNLFEHCNGELEIISNKSCDNLYEGNLFRECEGTLTLRHGNRCRVEGNVFLGNGRPRTGGIRIIGEGHAVTGNYLENLQGTEARAAICLMNGIPDSPANGYFQVKEAAVKGNFLIHCRESLGVGFADKDVSAPLPPRDSVLEGNVIHTTHRMATVYAADHGVRWMHGRVGGAELGLPGATTPVTEEEASFQAWMKATGRRPLEEGKVGPTWFKRGTA